MENMTEQDAMRVRDAVLADPTFFMSEAWCEEHQVTRGECEAFLDLAVEMARMRDWGDRNVPTGSVTTRLTFASHNAKVSDDEVKWTCYAPATDLFEMLRIAETGRLRATLTPELLPIDPETGEVV